MEVSSNFNHIVAKPLTEETKEDWFDVVKNYLISQDLWEVTSPRARPPVEGMKGYARWRRKNAAALHVILISCGPQEHSLTGAPTARVAWDLLDFIYNPPSLPPPQELRRRAEEIEMTNLFKAISDNNWSTAKEFIAGFPRVLEVEFGTSRGETPLHVAAKFGHVGIVEELVRLVAPEYLEIYDALGDTPLTIAAGHSGVIPIAECLIDKNRVLVAIPARRYNGEIPTKTDNGEIPTRPTYKLEYPVQLAFGSGLKEMGRYLYSFTPPQLLRDNLDLSTSVLATCLATGELEIVLDLLRQCEELLFADDFTDISTIEIIASLLPDSLDKSQLPFWKRWVYDYIEIPSPTTTERFYADVQQDVENNRAHQGLGLLHRLISSINNLSGMKEICKMKQQHAHAAEILSLVCSGVMILNKRKVAKISDALIAAARADKVEFLLQVTTANPELVSLVTFPQRKGHVFFDAVRDRRAEIFNLLRGFRFKHLVATNLSHKGDFFLHAVASLAPPSYLNQISGAALQMQRELQWFKAAESMVNPGYRNFVNEKGLSPLDLFKENHKELRKEGERWMKDTASSCSVVGTLIVTIMFAVAFTVPGGNDQASGYPIFLENELFIVFLISDALSLFSATTSVLTFLGILTSSRYAEEDFLYSLPRKLIMGFSTLFLSIATMMVAFSVTLIIMLQHNSSRLRAFLPIVMLGGIPITLFVLLQYPLLVELISSFYGPGIFKKVEKWP